LNNKSAISSFSVIVAFVALSLAGLAVIPYLPVKLAPSRTLPQLTVSFRMTGNSARIVEMEATSKLEAMLARIGGIRKISSTSNNNYGSITLELDKHTSMDIVRFEASTIIRQTWPSLPGALSYPVIHISRPDENSARPFLVYNLNATALPMVIQRYAEENIKPRLAQIKGVYKIEISGAMPNEWLLEYDIMQLDESGISVGDIREAISNHNSRESLGMVMLNDESDKDDSRDSAGRNYIRLSLTSETGNGQRGFQAGRIFVADKNGRLISLDKLVTVSYREQPPTSYYRINGLNLIYLSLTATDDANQLQLSAVVKKELEQIKALLPGGYEIHTDYDSTEYINSELSKIYIRTVATIVILLLFVFLTTFNARYLLLIVLSLFFNIATAFIFYYLFKLEIQIYSLAGITISLSLVIDNTIIMTGHYLHRRNRKAFLPILAATLTTVGALAMIFVLDDKIKLNLQDFAIVVIINMLVSLAVSLLLVPSIIEKTGLKRKPVRRFRRLRFSPKKPVVYFNRLYFLMIRLLLRFRWATLVILVLTFGLPVFMLPDEIKSESRFAAEYNKIVKSQVFKEKIRPLLEKSLGGTLRLFVQKVYEGSYFTRAGETVLSISASMPNGTTMSQMNRLMQQMESYLSEFREIKQFQTSIDNPRRATIQVYFTKAAAATGFPYTLKNNIISKALQLGGGSWGVYGLQDQGFSNDVREQAGSMRVKLFGYNYDDLYMHADTLRNRLMTYPRIKEVYISSQFSWYKEDYHEFSFNLDRRRMAAENLQPYGLYASLSPVFGRDILSGYVFSEDRTENIKLSSRQSRIYDLWSLSNLSRSLNGKYYKAGELAAIEKIQTPQSIVKEDQQYLLCLQYEYIGSSQQGNRILERELEAFNRSLPLGYTAESESYYYWWSKKDNRQYLFIVLIIIIIFFMSSILFNSLKQPLAIIFVIPVSYIGVFLTFYFFKLNFDQGGFASFILLCAITVNASIYLIYEYNAILKRKPQMNPLRAYIKAWNMKITPVFLTIISTILGFIPFMAGLDKEGFWFPLAAGTIGGLTMSFIAIFLYLPLFLLNRRKSI
jgi:multidrug efflux pump subunit AcrB